MTFEKSITFFFVQKEWYLNVIFYAKTILNYKKLWILKKLIPSGNYLTQTTLQSWISRILMQKNSLFSIFFKLSQMLSNDVETVPMCFVTLKSPPTTSEHILGSFEKTFSHRMFDLRNPFFAYGAKTVPECFATFKTTLKTSQHILGSLTFGSHFWLWSWSTLWKWQFMRVFKT